MFKRIPAHFSGTHLDEGQRLPNTDDENPVQQETIPFPVSSGLLITVQTHQHRSLCIRPLPVLGNAEISGNLTGTQRCEGAPWSPAAPVRRTLGNLLWKGPTACVVVPTTPAFTMLSPS